MIIHPDTKWIFSLLDNEDSWVHSNEFKGFRNQMVRQILTHYPTTDEDRKEFEKHPEIYQC